MCSDRIYSHGHSKANQRRSSVPSIHVNGTCPYRFVLSSLTMVTPRQQRHKILSVDSSARTPDTLREKVSVSFRYPGYPMPAHTTHLVLNKAIAGILCPKSICQKARFNTALSNGSAVHSGGCPYRRSKERSVVSNRIKMPLGSDRHYTASKCIQTVCGQQVIDLFAEA